MMSSRGLRHEKSKIPKSLYMYVYLIIHMYKKIAITENHLLIMNLFTKGFNKEYYIRQIHQITGLSPRAAQLILKDLEEKTVLESTVRGKIRAYKLKKSILTKQYLILSEIYKRLAVMQEDPLLKEIIEKITPAIRGIGIIFGSYAKRIQKKESDIDIFIVGDSEEKTIKSIGKMYNKDIQIKKYPFKVFNELDKKNILVNEVLENHIIIKGIEEFIESVKKIYE